MIFEEVLQKFRDISFSERDKGRRFERLMASFLKTCPLYKDDFSSVWLWDEFPSRKDFGSGNKDLGIDIVARTKNGEYWAVQCKCYKEDAVIDKAAVDTFLSTSGKSFYDTDDFSKKVKFACRLWLDTTNKGFNREADATIQNQSPEVKRLGYYDLIDAKVDWQKLYDGQSGAKAAVKKYEPLPHQQDAISRVHEYLKKNARGKLIMACGTGKTYTSLRIAEKETPKDGGLVLFLVPSIALLGQVLREWKNQCAKPVHAICVCSDATVSKSGKTSGDAAQMSMVDLAYPASTDVKNIKKQVKFARQRQETEGGNVVVFSTYQSIDVIIDAQKHFHREKTDSFLFDLIVCDEAHRTTGVTLSDGDDSAFVKVHDDKYIKARKRVYMTATPRIYSDGAQKKAREANAAICSMDDPEMYGGEMYRIGFGEAVSKNLLSDYKVLVLTVDESWVSDGFRKSIDERAREKNIEINAESMLKIVGAINALSKKSLNEKELFGGVDPALMRSAVVFCQKIAASKDAVHFFNICADAYFSTLTEEQRAEVVVVEADHVDGTMGAQVRERKLHWLKSADPSKRECKVLNNVRWASDRLDPEHGGVIGFVSNGSWLDGNGLDGFRKCLEMEFSSIYVYNLRGNQRTSGELSRKEGGKIFGSGSRTPVAVTILVKRGRKT
ncbi:MAG: DEAD/DEAH box helicase family protein [Chitinispirillales bacterium]|jgi:predicted helicase|nr:DEAD/DEAH box helicase family protein [Chitinispirillales bacterium]